VPDTPSTPPRDFARSLRPVFLRATHGRDGAKFYRARRIRELKISNSNNGIGKIVPDTPSRFGAVAAPDFFSAQLTVAMGQNFTGQDESAS